MRKTQVFASVTIAQAALESGWGRYAPGNNFFGIKADPSWQGATTTQWTWEYLNGVHERIEAKFRAYPDLEGSLDDHAAFLHDNPRYDPCFQCGNGEDFAYALQRCGYSTDPRYADKLVEIMRAHDLQRFDS